jgi:hypothetical protein
MLRKEAGLHPWLASYRSQKDLLVCDRQEDTVFLLTWSHASIDILARLDELQPAPKIETELLHRKLSQVRFLSRTLCNALRLFEPDQRHRAGDGFSGNR